MLISTGTGQALKMRKNDIMKNYLLFFYICIFMVLSLGDAVAQNPFIQDQFTANPKGDIVFSKL